MRSTVTLALSALLLASGSALGTGGTASRAVVIIDPLNPQSLLVGNAYVAARDIPGDRVLYMTPAPSDWNTFKALQRKALLGELTQRGLENNTDFVVIAPGGSFFMSAPGLVSDSCFPVNRFSVSGAYSLSLVADSITPGISSQSTQGFYRDSPQARGFDGSVLWLNGRPDAAGQRYFIGAMLGYTGQRGNTVAEILDNIDRSVLADGSRPAGTFYFMQTNDQARSGPRHGSYPQAVADITARGGVAEHRVNQGALPSGEHDCLGIMTGLASPGIAGANIGIIPGAFCDHLTSYAATFDAAAQEKVSLWIAKGASASWGQVEEPCNYAGKFPVPSIHVNYFQGLTLGEACFRSIGFLPFQGLLYGDPLTRAFTHIPAVTVPDLPSGPVSAGSLFVSPSGVTTRPGATILTLEAVVDGSRVASGPAGAPLAIDLTTIDDGWHDLRLIALDNSITASGGEFVAPLVVSRFGRSTSAIPFVTQGDLGTLFPVDVEYTGEGAIEVRLVHNGRVVAAAPGCSANLATTGANLGAGSVRLFAETLLADGSRIRSAPIDLVIDDAPGAPAPAAPISFSYTRIVDPVQPSLVELPFSSARDPSTAAVSTPDLPTRGTLSGSGGWRLYTPGTGASGRDTFTFQVTTADGASALATVTLLFGGYPCDRNFDRLIDVDDLHIQTQSPIDLNLDGAVDQADADFLTGIIRCDELRDMQGGR
ncbi:MAG: hypothetical protein IT439_02015 [Phycisphaerales bacterium]|nr:hypothetical protein [Phycisphaerales bacterium]